MIHTVSDTDQLHTALNAAKGGDTIKLQPGIYEGLTIRDMHFDAPVTITSADPNNPALFHNKTTVRDSSNLIFDGLEMQHTDPNGDWPNSSWNALLYVFDSNNITLSNSKLSGVEVDFTDEARNLHEGFSFGMGVYVTDSSDVLISGNELTKLFGGVNLRGTENVTVSGNHIHNIRVDGVAGTDQINTLIEQNLFENFKPYSADPDNPTGLTDDHTDMIQYWGTGADFGIDGFYVRDNVFLQGSGVTQTVFGRLNLRPTDDADAISLKNFEVSGNLIYNGHNNGITLSDVNGAKVFNNTVLANEQILGDFRDVPTVNVRYDGPSAAQAGFDLNSDKTQASRNIEVYDNVLSHAHSEEVIIYAHSKNVNDRDEVMASLNISEHDNHWISTRLPAAEYFEYVSKLAYETDGKTSTVSLDNRSAEIHGNKGSAYYTDANALQDFLNNLNTTVKFDIDTKLTEGLIAQAVSHEVPSVAPQAAESNVELDMGISRASAVAVKQRPAPLERTVQEESVVTFGSKSQIDETISGSGRLRGSDENDVMAGALSDDFLTGGGGDDVADAGAGDDRLYGNDGEDILVGNSGDDHLNGGADADILVGGAGDDLLIGGAGYDIAVLFGKPSDYVISMDSGVLQIEAIATGDIDKIIITEAIYFEETDQLYAVDQKSGATTLLDPKSHGESYNSVRNFDGGEYDIAALYGKPSDYVISMDADALKIETIATGEVDEIPLPEAIYFESSDQLYTVDQASGTTSLLDPKVHEASYDSVRKLSLSDAKNILQGDDGDNKLSGSDEADIILGVQGKDTLFGNEGDDVVSGGAGNDFVSGRDGEDLLLGGSGKDFINGGRHNDIIVGGLGDDGVFGGSGVDTLVVSGSRADYTISKQSTPIRDKIALTHKQTGETDLLVGIEQIYFEQQGQLYELSENGTTRSLKAGQNQDAYDILESSPWNAFTDEMIY